MSLQRKAYSASTEALADKRQVRVICSTGDIDRAGEIVVQAGIDLSAYKTNPVVLWQHDVNHPVARSIEIGVEGGKLMALVEFPPEGISAKSDEIYGLVKAQVINAVSIGFNPVETEPLDAANPKKGPQKYVKCELAEFSFVSVPALRTALVVERQNKAAGENWKVGASRNLPVEDVAGWNADNAAAAILEKAGFGGDKPDLAFARKGFLVYDAAAPHDVKSYRHPFATVKDGRLVAVSTAFINVVDGIDEESIPTDVAEKACAVVEHYEGKMTNKSGKPGAVNAGVKLEIKGLYDVANLAYLLQSLAYAEENAQWEAAYEEDGSKVPQMLADALRVLADAFLAMTAEEVAELLTEDTAEGAAAVAKGLVAKEASPFKKAVAAVRAKSGAKFSKATKDAVTKACKSISDGHEMVKDGHDAITKMFDYDESDEDDDESEDKGSMPDMGKSADELRQKRIREVEVLRLSTP